ncbi:MAG: hypothetical protein R3202_00855, partial [Candidatus Competibacterales bacterium]|nr:hypothetical protein [Candidatus Competibacterales bacterium]
GGGSLPQAVTALAPTLYAADPLSRGLARHAGLAVQPPPVDPADWREILEDGDPALIVLGGLRPAVAAGDAPAWCEHVRQLDRDGFAPLLEALRRGRLRQIALQTGDGRRRVLDRAGLRRFWRRPRPLSVWLGDVR